ncbi:hypothetical protein BFJ72_g6903 [Fusarium proliferatum]|uniref:FAD-binding domain-containing protein n=1 Tax=Gibberella intermedia TaxID=948311 RepID=A0A420TDA9_GIBIN|nr:hypothetical protein BFJ72_g6903 [Fusarium proliferatum]
MPGAPIEQAATMQREAPSGLDILIIGGGIAGLGFAIEAYRKGHNVSIIERRPDFNDYGDLIAIQQSALYTPEKWPGFMDRCREHRVGREGVLHYKYDGTYIGSNAFPLAMSRAVLHDTLNQYVRGLGIEVKFSTRVVDYFETDDHAGVTLDDGSKLCADIVVASDGVGSKSWSLVSGYKEKPVSSGYALFRATYPVDLALDKPHIAEEYGNVQDKCKLFAGDGAHIIIARAGPNMIFMLTHKDTGTAEEEWTKQTSVDHALPHVEGWSPEVRDIIESAPNREAVDFKLMWRNPRENWASPKKRVIQIGDAAHTFLPTSTSGATTALEDGFSLAACLQLAGKKDAPLAVTVHNHFRAERVACAQRMGFKNQELFHSADWDAVARDPTAFLTPAGKWMVNHDPETYAYDNYAACASHFTDGTPFQNTNAVPGFSYKPWTVQELLAASDRGERLVDEGEW